MYKYDAPLRYASIMDDKDNFVVYKYSVLPSWVILCQNIYHSGMYKYDAPVIYTPIMDNKDNILV